ARANGARDRGRRRARSGGCHGRFAPRGRGGRDARAGRPCRAWAGDRRHASGPPGRRRDHRVRQQRHRHPGRRRGGGCLRGRTPARPRHALQPDVRGSVPSIQPSFQPPSPRHMMTKMTHFDWKFPYHSQRMPLLARNVVASSQPLAAQAGLSMLMKGGNAVDAALATAITLTVVEPTGNGIGSDAFAILWDGGKLHGLNASGRSPVAWTPERFKGRTAMPATGWDSVTVPGAVSAWVALSDRFGKLPFADLFEPAIRYASDGFMVSHVIARLWARQAPSLEKVPGFAEHLMVSGRAPAAGERFTAPAHARALKRIAETKGQAFYTGDLAESM